MQFNIRLGVPEMQRYWDDLSARNAAGKLRATEKKSFSKLGKAFYLLSQNPRHNSLVSHEIVELSSKLGVKVFQSYLENNTPAAGRFFWAYGPGKLDITILAIESHPEDQKRGAYRRIKLSHFP